jgi:hypothetical protein
MKRIIIGISFFLVIAGNGYSQSSQEDIDLFVTAFGMEKKALTREFMKIDPAQTREFWSLFDAYEAERQELATKRWILFNQYIAQIESMTDEQADEMMKEIMVQSKKSNKLIDTYYKKIKKSTSVKVAAKFYQLEHYLLSGIRMEILSLVPFMGELD